MSATETRSRKHHTRSKAGCLTCRKRRVRCDGNIPSWASWLPGQQQPWAVPLTNAQPDRGTISPVTKSMGDFDCLGLDMSFKSRQLLDYFRQTNGCLDILPAKAAENIFSSVAQHPDALRDTLLVAGLHYAWTAGDLHTYEATFLFHKVNTLHILNGWLQNIRRTGLMTFIRHVSILCLLDGCRGDVAAAETHLDGLANAVQLLSPLDDGFLTRCGLDEELANRYLIFFKARIQGSDTLTNMFRRGNTAEFSDFMTLIHDWKAQKVGSLEARLNAMKLLPFFFTTLPPNHKFHEIDGSTMVECLKHSTVSIDIATSEHDKRDPGWVWVEGSESRLLYAIVSSHLTSLFEEGDSITPEDLKLRTSWPSICVASGLYLHSVLELWNRGAPIDAFLFRRFLLLLKRDLDEGNLDTEKYSEAAKA
ncbi:hypothetical protein FZEAL_1921 [Fusarium zealandicum]|uniref:Zn(2)-C6 fungal-type domain-containing protein n=1 Tax=Fusarium zealandicum TaxID=1053134 RepID=A0A8H4USI3_9HYPO|nr:hypothetical protein FZEAL_1921 [Fusarium zealandicum]